MSFSSPFVLSTWKNYTITEKNILFMSGIKFPRFTQCNKTKLVLEVSERITQENSRLQIQK